MANADKGAQTCIKNKELTDALIAATPDFSILLGTAESRDALRGIGLDERFDGLDGLGTRGDYRDAGSQEPRAGGQASPFAPDTQLRLELQGAGRLDTLRARRAGEPDATYSTRGDSMERTDLVGDGLEQRRAARPVEPPAAADLVAQAFPRGTKLIAAPAENSHHSLLYLDDDHAGIVRTRTNAKTDRRSLLLPL